MATDRGAHLGTSPWGLPDRLVLKPKRLWVMVMMMTRISTWAPGAALEPPSRGRVDLIILLSSSPLPPPLLRVLIFLRRFRTCLVPQTQG